MSALSKTHRLQRVKKNEYTKKRRGFPSIIPKNIKKLAKGYEHVLFNLKVRDLLVFDGNLIHKSNTNQSTKCRVIGIHRMTKV